MWAEKFILKLWYVVSLCFYIDHFTLIVNDVKRDDSLTLDWSVPATPCIGGCSLSAEIKGFLA